tara:strand:+ start:1832 stop:2365 length:534 start_codon:yes stop_codon:yes gene_type:complete
MERDIRDLFKEKKDIKIELPKNHREEFFQKLHYVDKERPKKKNVVLLKIAAVIALVFCGTFFYFKDFSSIKKTAKTEIQVQIELFENEYLTNINKEWESFIKVANDSVLVKKYKVKLKESVTDYKKITNQLKENPDNINVLESLINNLQRRLELIKNIKEHINELNQKNISYETIYI